MAAPININANLNLNPASINASAKQVQQALGRITGQASEFQKSLDASTARVFAFGATTSVINGITQSFKNLVSTSITVQAKLTEINTILGAGAGEFNKYRNSIFKVAKSTGQSFNTVAEGAAELARQGLGATESAKRLEAALVLTRISGLGAEQSVKALTAAMNGFTSAGLSAEQIVNKIVAVDTAFAVSAQDLAEGFSRAGSTAEDAGVSFEQLLALITAVEQRTARGGAVIGNAFKSIFTRISRGDTIESLKELGVQIDANQNGVQKLQALSDALEKISDPTKVSAIKELAGGVFQINVVSAALKDLGSDASVFAEATETGLNATNEATQKNTELNKTLLAQINSLTVSITSFADKLGGITFGPLLENLVSLATKLSEGLDGALDPEKGNKFIQGIFKIIGGFISGPGLAIFTVAFAKIFKTVLKFAKDGFKTVMEMGSATERIKTIESGIVGLLQKDDTLRKKITNSTTSLAEKEQAVIQAIQRENQLLQQQEDLVKSIARQAASKGVRGFDPSRGFTGKRGKRYAAGGGGRMEPDLMTALVNESRDAPRGASPFVTNFRGKPAVMNTSEAQVKIGGREEILTQDQIPRFNKGTRGLQSKGTYAFLVPQVGVRGFLPSSTVQGQKFAGGATVRGPQKNKIQGASDTSEANLEGQIEKNLFSSAAKWTQKLMPLGRKASYNDVQRGFKGIAGAKGALKSAVGSAFEVGISKSLDYQAAGREKGGDFDVRGGANISRIQELFGIKESIADFKASQSRGNISSFYSKVGREKKAGKMGKRESDRVARSRAEERDRRKNPQFYTKSGELKNTSGAILARSGRIAGSLKRFKSIQNYAKGSLPLGRRDNLGRKITMPSMGNNVKINVADEPITRGQKLKSSLSQTGGLGAGIGLSTVATGLDALSKSAKDAGESTKSAAIDLTSSATQFAATGAMIAGPWGAAAGIIIALGKSIFDSVGKIEEAGKKEREMLQPSAKFTSLQITEGAFGTQGLDRVRSRLSDLASTTGRDDLDIGKEITKAKKELDATTVGTLAFSKASKKYASITNRAAKILDNDLRIQTFSSIGDTLRKNLEELAKNNLGANLSKQLARGQEIQSTRSSLMQGVQGPAAGIINRGNAIAGKVLETGQARAKVLDLQAQFEAERDPEKSEALKGQLREAGVAFRNSVKESAIFMQQKQTEIANELKANAKERAELSSRMLNETIGGITKGVREGPLDLDVIKSFRDEFKSAKTDQERGSRIAELEGLLLSRGDTPEMVEALKKMAGLGSDATRSLISTDALQALEGKLRFKGGTAAQRSTLAGTTSSRQTGGQIAKIDEETKALQEQGKRIRQKMDTFGKAFNAAPVVNAIRNTATTLNNAASNLKNLEQATGAISGVITNVHKLTTSANENIKSQQKEIDQLRRQILSMDSKVQKLQD